MNKTKKIPFFKKLPMEGDTQCTDKWIKYTFYRLYCKVIQPRKIKQWRGLGGRGGAGQENSTRRWPLSRPGGGEGVSHTGTWVFQAGEQPVQRCWGKRVFEEEASVAKTEWARQEVLLQVERRVGRSCKNLKASVRTSQGNRMPLGGLRGEMTRPLY